MAQVAITPDQQARLQAEIQRELERREWAEPDDNVMAEYITVLLANGSTQERVQTEMDDLVGSDFDPRFLDWLFAKAREVSTAVPDSLAPSSVSASIPPAAPSGPGGGSRLLNTALAPLSQPADANKRKLDNGQDGQNKKRLSDGVAIPAGPRGMSSEGRGLAERLGPGRGGRGGMQVRGMAGGRQPGGPGQMNGMGMGMGMGPMGYQPGFRQGMMQPGFGAPFFAPGQQEMMAQMMMMQANMAQMGEMMAQMAEEKKTAPVVQAVRPVRPSPVKVPHGTKLGQHSVSVIPPKTTAPLGPIPSKPTSTVLCKYSVGCSNARCPYSHPSPVADEKTGMVLSEEACELGTKCKDPECTKSHVSPAAVLGETAGPSRLLCKYLNCSNPSCPFRHEDAEGKPIPPPALAAAKAAKEAKSKKVDPVVAEVAPTGSDNEDGDVEVVMSSKGLMDGALDDTKGERVCRYGDRCTRPDCKFTHPASRSTPRVHKSFGSRPIPTPSPYKRPVNGHGNGVAKVGMNVSKKFGAAAEKKLDPSASDFKPAAEVTVAEPEKAPEPERAAEMAT